MIEEYTYQLKFVIDSTADCDLVDDYLQEFPEIDQQHVYLMPQGVTQEELAEKSKWLEPICQQRGITIISNMGAANLLRLQKRRGRLHKR